MSASKKQLPTEPGKPIGERTRAKRVVDIFFATMDYLHQLGFLKISIVVVEEPDYSLVGYPAEADAVEAPRKVELVQKTKIALGFSDELVQAFLDRPKVEEDAHVQVF